LDRFQALSVFTKVVELGGFARAADRLGVSTSAVSRQVAELESHLGVRLLNRTTRRLSLTESGAAFLERAVQLLADLEEAETAVTAAALVPRGTLRLTAPITFGERYLAPAIADFVERHPEVKLDCELSDRFVDLVEEGLDLAVRIGSGGSGTLIARRLAAVRLVCHASPGYLERIGTPQVPEDLARHRCLTYAYLSTRDTWLFRDPGGGERAVRVGGPVHSNNGRLLAVLAAHGVGISMEPDFAVGDEISSGRSVPILTRFEPAPIPVYAVYPSRRHLSAKVRAFVDFLAARFAGTPPWSLGGAAGRAARKPR
jgi:DNA-binding transcriptional LysR family regulator